MGKRRARRTKLELTVARIHHRFGPQSLVKGKPPAILDAPTVPHIPTGFAKLDNALGIGGLPKGKVSELLGLPTSGKTTLALKFLVQAQSGGDHVAYVDQARYFDPDYAHRCGLDLSRLLIGTPYGAEEALAMAEAMARSGGLAALVFDTMDLVWHEPRTARLLSAFLSRLSAPLSRSGTIFLFLHDSPGTESTALSTLAHCAAVRLQVTRESWRRLHGDIRGYEARVKVLKNRLGPARRAVTIAIQFNGTVHGDDL